MCCIDTVNRWAAEPWQHLLVSCIDTVALQHRTVSPGRTCSGTERRSQPESALPPRSGVAQLPRVPPRQPRASPPAASRDSVGYWGGSSCRPATVVTACHGLSGRLSRRVTASVAACHGFSHSTVQGERNVRSSAVRETDCSPCGGLEASFSGPPVRGPLALPRPRRLIRPGIGEETGNGALSLCVIRVAAWIRPARIRFGCCCAWTMRSLRIPSVSRSQHPASQDRTRPSYSRPVEKQNTSPAGRPERAPGRKLFRLALSDRKNTRARIEARCGPEPTSRRGHRRAEAPAGPHAAPPEAVGGRAVRRRI